ncbi:MAG: retroviral-like aspartic protease family protein [Rhizomicrobium sp.]
MMVKHAHAALAVALFALSAFSGCEAAPAPPATTAAIPMKKDGGVYVVPVSANGSAPFDCIVDSGASDVNIPGSVFRKLLRAGSVRESDFVGVQEYTLADGSTQRGRTYRIKSLKVGNIVVNNVVASVGGDSESGLLGQSFLERFGSWSVDNRSHTLALVGPPRPVTAPAEPAKPAGHAPPRVSGAPDTASVAQTSGAGSARDGESAEPADDHLVAQHSE